MKKIAFVAIATLALSSVHADYTVTIPLNSKINFYSWSPISPLFGDWVNIGNIYDCSNWSPSSSTITTGQSFLQTATDCKQDQTRTIQKRETDSISGSIRNIGSPYNENNTILSTSSRNAVGVLETWLPTTPSYTNWTNDGQVISCSNWTPDPATITIGLLFTQTATDCQQPQIRSRQDREQETTTFVIRDKGAAVKETKSIIASSTRQSTGLKETWALITPTYTEWANNGVLNSCTNWSPAPSTVTINQAFTQTATDCKQSQTRNKQDREQESTTLEIRNKGIAITENQIVSATSTRASTGTKETWATTTPTYTNWVNNGAITACSNWTPSPTTVTVGQSFTQTATDCQQAQTRSRQDREKESTTGAFRNVGSAVTESQSITASSTRTSTGTKETWVATTPTSTDWINSGAVTGCSNWSPEPSTFVAGTSFPQTATDCSQSQTRSTQNREQETTTGAIRNNGSAFTETQSIAASSTRTAIGTKVVQECNGYFTFKMSTQSEMGLYGPTKMTAYWAGSAFYNGKPQNFSYGGYNYVMQSSVSGGGLCRTK